MPLHSEMPCTRCAGPLVLQGKSKNEAKKLGIIVPSDHHDFGDCIRHLASMIG